MKTIEDNEKRTRGVPLMRDGKVGAQWQMWISIGNLSLIKIRPLNSRGGLVLFTLPSAYLCVQGKTVHSFGA